jgi:hypothetical protein
MTKLKMNLYDECFEYGLTLKLSLVSPVVTNINKPVNWLCINCGNKFMESFINLKINNKGCLKCSYKKFN